MKKIVDQIDRKTHKYQESVNMLWADFAQLLIECIHGKVVIFQKKKQCRNHLAVQSAAKKLQGSEVLPRVKKQMSTKDFVKSLEIA